MADNSFMQTVKESEIKTWVFVIVVAILAFLTIRTYVKALKDGK